MLASRGCDTASSKACLAEHNSVSTAQGWHLLAVHPSHHTCVAQGGPRSFFSEIISSISDVRFSRDGRHMLSRDYMTVKLWDINMENRPIASFPVHEPLREKVFPSLCAVI